MRGFRYTIIGFFGFLLVTTFNISIGILIYSFIEKLDEWMIALIILVVIILSAALCSLIDFIRRKITIEKPLDDILNATEEMARGNFNLKLYPEHTYQYYDEFDIIKTNLNQMAEELSKSELLKNDFIANVSHEIKTPLSVIQNYAKALKNKSLDEESRNKYLDNLQDATRRLSTLVTNILKLNKLENQKLIPEITRFNLSELLTNQILQFEELVEQKGIELECEIQEDLYINSEESYLEIVFNNLMSNAIKFTENNGKIYVSLSKVNNEYIIKFKDTGCGMDKKTGTHIFEKFYQGDTSHSKQGNGLGLALVKKVIDILGGSISVESELNVGSTFIVVVREL